MPQWPPLLLTPSLGGNSQRKASATDVVGMPVISVPGMGWRWGRRTGPHTKFEASQGENLSQTNKKRNGPALTWYDESPGPGLAPETIRGCLMSLWPLTNARLSKTSSLGLPPPCTTCSQAHPPPGVDVSNVHEGIIFLQGLIFIEDLHLEGKMSP